MSVFTSVCVYVKMHAGLHVCNMCVQTILYVCTIKVPDHPTNGYSYHGVYHLGTTLYDKMISDQVVVCKRTMCNAC